MKTTSFAAPTCATRASVPAFTRPTSRMPSDLHGGWSPVPYGLTWLRWLIQLASLAVRRTVAVEEKWESRACCHIATRSRCILRSERFRQRQDLYYLHGQEKKVVWYLQQIIGHVWLSAWSMYISQNTQQRRALLMRSS